MKILNSTTCKNGAKQFSIISIVGSIVCSFQGYVHLPNEGVPFSCFHHNFSLSLTFFLHLFSLRLQTGRSLEIHELVYVLFLLLRLFRSRLTSFAKNLFLYFPYPFFFIILLIFSDFVELRAFYGFLTKTHSKHFVFAIHDNCLITTKFIKLLFKY